MIGRSSTTRRCGPFCRNIRGDRRVSGCRCRGQHGATPARSTGGRDRTPECRPATTRRFTPAPAPAPAVRGDRDRTSAAGRRPDRPSATPSVSKSSRWPTVRSSVQSRTKARRANRQTPSRFSYRSAQRPKATNSRTPSIVRCQIRAPNSPSAVSPSMTIAYHYPINGEFGATRKCGRAGKRVEDSPNLRPSRPAHWHNPMHNCAGANGRP